MPARRRPRGRAPAIALALSLLAGCAVVVPGVVVVSVAADCDPLGVSATQLAEQEIPADYLALYHQAAHEHGVPWTVLAAIGWKESRHGTLDAPGVRSGANHAGAAGPMQFGIGGRAGNTWGGDPVRAVPPTLAYGTDGNGDGIADVYDPADAIPAAARYLVTHGAPDDLRGALYAYNHAGWYVDQVLAKAAQYGADGAIVAAPAGYIDPDCLPHTGDAPANDQAGPWGGHHNGRIPLEELCLIGRGHRLRCDAAAAFNAMNAAYLAQHGRPIIVTDSYRDRAAQADVHRRKPHLAAPAGSSNHGWGVAVDLAVGGWNGELFRWLQANAHRFGWHHPTWARADGSKPEPWHWEYRR